MPVESPSGWKELEIQNVVDEIIDYRGKTPKKVSSGIPLITAKIVKGGRIAPPQEFIDPLEYDLWMRRGLPKAGDVLITTEAPLGEVAQLDNPRVALAQRLILLRGKQGVLDNTFLRYALQSEYVQRQLHARSSGTTVLGIRQSELRRVSLLLPPFNEQYQIGEILSRFDDKIELNRRMNKTLESMARAVFKAWFVDFEPVKAKAAGATSFPGMPQEVFDELPNELVESSDQEVPKGWSLKPVSELFEVNPTRRLTKGTIAPYLEMANMPTQGHAPDEWIDRPFNSGMRFINGDTLVARITPCLENGKTAYVDFLADDEIGWGSTEYIVLRPKSPLPTIYAYCLARTESVREFLIQNMTGTSGRQRVSHTALDHIIVAEPSPTVAKAFGELVAPWFALARNHKLESKTLAAIRDALLPKLLSGTIRVPAKSSSPAETAYVD